MTPTPQGEMEKPRFELSCLLLTWVQLPGDSRGPLPGFIQELFCVSFPGDLQLRGLSLLLRKI